MTILLNRLWRHSSSKSASSLAVAATAALLALAAMTNPASAQTKIELFLAPNTDSTPLWAAYSQGFYEDAGLDVSVRTFPSGTTAFQAFRTGLGTMVMSGDLPSVRYWINSDKDYRAIQVLTRHTKGYVVETRSEITKPEDLIGKNVATRVGSSGSWLLSEYLTKNGIGEDQVNILNLDTNQMPIALCKGDISAFFVWQPFGDQAEANCGEAVHQLSDATGYMRGYTVLGARPAWLEENRDAANDFVKATVRGAVWATENPEELAKYLEDNYGADAEFSKQVLTFMDLTPLFDEQFRSDFTSLSEWNLKQGDDAQPIDFETFLWTDAVDQLQEDELPPVPAAAKE